jgi:hypothetical protein
MEQNKEIKRLLKLVLDEVYRLEHMPGLCNIVNYLSVQNIITPESAKLLRNYIYNSGYKGKYISILGEGRDSTKYEKLTVFHKTILGNKTTSIYLILPKEEQTVKSGFYWKPHDIEERGLWLEQELNK